MDYKGHQLSENIYYFLTIICGLIAWIVGYVKEDFQLTVYGWTVGLVLSLILCIPDWPMFNRNPVHWLDEVGSRSSNKGSSTKGSKDDKKDKKKSKTSTKKDKDLSSTKDKDVSSTKDKDVSSPKDKDISSKDKNISSKDKEVTKDKEAITTILKEDDFVSPLSRQYT